MAGGSDYFKHKTWFSYVPPNTSQNVASDKVLRHLNKQQESRDLGQTHHKTYNKFPNSGVKIILFPT